MTICLFSFIIINWRRILVFYVFLRSIKLVYRGENVAYTVKKYGDIEKHLRDYQKLTGKYIVFQGELCGPGIQSNRLALDEKEWFIFNLRRYGSRENNYF